MQQGNRVFPVVFPVGGASLVASPLRSDYPSYAPGYWQWSLNRWLVTVSLLVVDGTGDVERVRSVVVVQSIELRRVRKPDPD